MTVSEIGYSNCSDIYNYKRSSAFTGSDSGRHDSPTKSGSPVKSASPFKDKFRLQNLFSKKKNRKSESYDAYDGSQQNCLRRRARPISAVVGPDIQRRNLPPLPPADHLTDGCAVGAFPIVVGNSLDHMATHSSSNESPSHRPHQTLSAVVLPVRDYPSALSRNASGSTRNHSLVNVPLNTANAASAVSISPGSITSMTSHDNHNVETSTETYGNEVLQLVCRCLEYVIC